jgi:MFS family permease
MNIITRQTTDRGKILILVSICVSALVLPLSFSAGAVATPAIGRELGGDPMALTWITNAFMLSFGSLLMAAGAVADQFGRKRVFTVGVALFTATSLALSIAPTVFWVDALRAGQGVASAAALASGSAALAQEFEGHERIRAFSALGTTFGIGLAFGPLIAGALIEVSGWRAIFLLTATLGATALLVATPRMRETRDPNARGLDWPGTLTLTSSLALFTYGVIKAPQSGWTSASVVALLASSCILLTAFIVIEIRVKRPMLDVTLFRYPRFVGVQILPIGTCCCYIVLVVMLPIRLIGIEGLRELEAGWLMLALSAPMLGVPALAAFATRRIPAAVLCGVGFLIAAAGLYWLSLFHWGDSKLGLVMPMLLIGVGAGMPWGLMDGLSVSVVPKERAGMAAGIFNTAKVAGEGITLAIVVAVLSGLVETHLHGAMTALGAIDTAQLAESAQHLVTGDLIRASASLPQLGRPLILANYHNAYRSLLDILAVVTVLSAVTVFGFLNHARPTPGESGSTDATGDNSSLAEARPHA